VRTVDAVLPQQSTQSQFGLRALQNVSVSMSDKVSEFSNVKRREPDAGDVPNAGEVGEQFRICPIGLIGRLLHPGDIAGLGEFDVPLVLRDQFFGEIGGAGTGFDGGGNMAAETLVPNGATTWKTA